MNNRINELKRRLSLRKNKYKSELEYVVDTFGIDGEQYMKEYDELSEEVIQCGIDLVNNQQRMDDLDLKYEKLKKSLLLRENIDLKQKLNEFGDDTAKKNVVDLLFKNGFITTEESNILVDDIWRNRYRPQYGD